MFRISAEKNREFRELKATYQKEIRKAKSHSRKRFYKGKFRKRFKKKRFKAI